MIYINNVLIKDRTEAQEAIRDIIQKTQKMIYQDATDIADEFGIQFDIGEYGTDGQTYYPVGTKKDEFEYINMEPDFDENDVSIEGIWISSSDNC